MVEGEEKNGSNRMSFGTGNIQTAEIKKRAQLAINTVTVDRTTGDDSSFLKRGHARTPAILIVATISATT
jgi:hypothetical protein